MKRYVSMPKQQTPFRPLASGIVRAKGDRHRHNALLYHGTRVKISENRWILWRKERDAIAVMADMRSDMRLQLQVAVLIVAEWPMSSCKPPSRGRVGFAVKSLSCHRNWRRRACHPIPHRDIASMINPILTPLALNSTTVWRFDVAGAIALDFAITIQASTASWSLPHGHVPGRASERLELETFLLPASTRLAGAVESAETSVDGSRIGFGTEFVGWYGCCCRSAAVA